MISDSTAPQALNPYTPRRDPKPLRQRLAKRLLAYTTMAGAGLAASSTSQAEIVYTKTHTDVNLDYTLDLNNDGIGDFRIQSYYLSGFASLVVIPFGKNKIAAVHHQCGFRGYHSVAAGPLPLGAVIGPNSPFEATATCMVRAFESSAPTGPWLDKTDRYLGLEFYIYGEKHFGWARMSVQSAYCYSCIGYISGYAYETIAGKPIAAGDEGNSTNASVQPALGALALGAPALDLWRRQPGQE
ncbi:MAG: hypothetical protein WAM04_08125 [Candidatus Sulfotelmatobacter sp.]